MSLEHLMTVTRRRFIELAGKLVSHPTLPKPFPLIARLTSGLRPQSEQLHLGIPLNEDPDWAEVRQYYPTDEHLRSQVKRALPSMRAAISLGNLRQQGHWISPEDGAELLRVIEARQDHLDSSDQPDQGFEPKVLSTLERLGIPSALLDPNKPFINLNVDQQAEGEGSPKDAVSSMDSSMDSSEVGKEDKKAQL